MIGVFKKPRARRGYRKKKESAARESPAGDGDAEQDKRDPVGAGEHNPVLAIEFEVAVIKRDHHVIKAVGPNELGEEKEGEVAHFKTENIDPENIGADENRHKAEMRDQSGEEVAWASLPGELPSRLFS